MIGVGGKVGRSDGYGNLLLQESLTWALVVGSVVPDDMNRLRLSAIARFNLGQSCFAALTPLQRCKARTNVSVEALPGSRPMELFTNGTAPCRAGEPLV